LRVAVITSSSLNVFRVATLEILLFRSLLTSGSQWVDDPSGRGTWNLLYSCGFTLVLCVWTSIHLNVPPPRESAWLGWRRKLKWVVIALFAPEIVVFTAFQQWLTARLFLKELEKLHRAITAKNSEVHGFRACYLFD
jgi:hypothetical protein